MLVSLTCARLPVALSGLLVATLIAVLLVSPFVASPVVASPAADGDDDVTDRIWAACSTRSTSVVTRWAPSI